MAHRIKEAFQIEVNHIHVTGIDYFLRSSQGVVASSSRTEAKASRGKLALIDGSQGLIDGLLHHTVDYRRNTQ